MKRSELCLNVVPHPLKWSIAILLLFALTIVWHSAIGILAGMAVGAYFGNYAGRSAVMKAWRLQMDLDHKRTMAELESSYLNSTQGKGPERWRHLSSG
jgi:hypothetical protein